MKKKLSSKLFALIFCFCCTVNNGVAQYITIPDVNFLNYLSDNGYFQCLNGNQLDTTCPAVLSATSIDCSSSGISDLEGIEYFKNLDSLWCTENSLTSLPRLPQLLKVLACNNNQLNSLPPFLPDSLIYLNCRGNQLQALPPLPNSLTRLSCYGNHIMALPPLPSSLRRLNCGANRIDSLPALPSLIDTIDCNLNLLRFLPGLPDSLLYLDCSYNHIDSLPTLHSFLRYLNCDSNFITSLPVLPNSLLQLSCYSNQLHSLPDLPPSLTFLSCWVNQIQTLPALPNSLLTLICTLNRIDSLPKLPDSLQELDCGINLLQFLPVLPATLSFLDCDSNYLSSIPELPDSMYAFVCSRNADLHCLPKLKRIFQLNFTNTGVTCIPNYGNVTESYPPLDSLPLCTTGNQYGCAVYASITEVAPIAFNVYPTPANEQVTLNTDASVVGGDLKVFDITGQLVLSTKVESGNMRLDVSKLNDGIYIMNIEKEKRAGRTKLVVEK